MKEACPKCGSQALQDGRTVSAVYRFRIGEHGEKIPLPETPKRQCRACGHKWKRDERGRNLNVDEKVRLAREKFGFIKCPECGTEHTAKTVTCRGCGYRKPELFKERDKKGEQGMEGDRIAVKRKGVGIMLGIRTNAPIEIIGNGNALIGCTMNVPCPEELNHVTLKGLCFTQEGDMLVISAPPVAKGA